jgi:glycerol-3-phosphate dehydrogenase
VFEALHERNVLLRNVPYLSQSLPIMMVCGAGWGLIHVCFGSVNAPDANAGACW